MGIKQKGYVDRILRGYCYHHLLCEWLNGETNAVLVALSEDHFSDYKKAMADLKKKTKLMISESQRAVDFWHKQAGKIKLVRKDRKKMSEADEKLGFFQRFLAMLNKMPIERR